MYKCVAFDVDGVLTKVESAWQYVHEKLNTWDKARVNMELYFNKMITYEEWAYLDALLWKGVSYNKFMEIFDSIPINDGFEKALSRIKSLGLKIIAISGGLMPLLERLNKIVRFDDMYATELIFENGIFTGKVIVHVKYGNKDMVLLNACKKHGFSTKECIVVGDSEIDIPMFAISGYSIAFNPKNQKVAKAANKVINSESLNPIADIIEELVSYSRL
ncbi:MAG: HAD-IB family phosphatase [Thermoprotei archaeon]|jgi:phosphoserine phosphatase